MKVIVAGCSKTGTKSMNAALTELGYKVYDNMEHIMYHCDDWIKIFEGKGRIEDFKRMYKDVDAIVDVPAFLYWYEIHQAFPEAKIILTTRDEDAWFKSLKNQIQILNDFYSTFLSAYAFKFLPLGWKSLTYMKGYIPELTGVPIKVGQMSIQHPLNEMIARRRFRERNSYVLQVAPKEKLLVYDVKQGWEPLCEFLQCKIPSKQFPHKNVGGRDLVKSTEAKYKRKAQKQFVVSVLVFATFIFLLCYLMSDYSFSTQILTSLGSLLVLFFMF